MKIVIDIPHNLYKWICEQSTNTTMLQVVYSAVKQGILLPKGHGDLIDRDYFIDKYAGCGSVYCEDNSCNECNSRIVNKLDVDNAPTVIPADK